MTISRVVGVIAVAVLAACGGDDKPEAPPLRPVRYQTVEAQGGVRTRTFSGVSEAGVESRLSFKVAGTVTQLSVVRGDSVAKGAPIARLDDTDYKLQLQQARAQYASASAQSRNAKASYERVLALYENRNASRGDLDGARAAYETTRANVSAASQAVALAKQQLMYTELRAPVDGAVAAVLVEKDENVSPGAPIVVLTAGEKPKVTVAVPEQLIGDVESGRAAVVKFEAIAGKTFPGTVSEVAVSMSQATGSFPVTITLDDATDAVRPGMAAEVELAFGSPDDAPKIVVPTHAVGEDRQGQFVFLLTKQGEGTGVVVRTPVTVGELSADGLEIVDGVEAGQLLVTAGVSRISDGLEVAVP